MRAVVQRVINCSVAAAGKIVGNINKGILVYLGVEENDSEKDVKYITDKVVNLRIFNDYNNKMNLSLKDIGGELLLVSQFTLLGDVRRGRRPSYSRAADPEYAKKYYHLTLRAFKESGLKVEAGRFREVMEINYTNIGPVTILLDSRKVF